MKGGGEAEGGWEERWTESDGTKSLGKFELGETRARRVESDRD